MKQFIGWIMVAAGAVGTAYGGFHMLSGRSAAILHPLPVSAMTGGLASLACLTLGLIATRD